MRISELLLKLIEKKYYVEKEQIENKLNIFYANKISDEEYSSLVLKAEEVYAEATENTEETDNITEETTASTEEKAEE